MCFQNAVFLATFIFWNRTSKKIATSKMAIFWHFPTLYDCNCWNWLGHKVYNLPLFWFKTLHVALPVEPSKSLKHLNFKPNTNNPTTYYYFRVTYISTYFACCQVTNRLKSKRKCLRNWPPNEPYLNTNVFFQLSKMRNECVLKSFLGDEHFVLKVLIFFSKRRQRIRIRKELV